METRFSLAQLADPTMRESEKILRSCVHCGFCTATCPTYVLLGDELDSPRGRIYLIKDMLENDKPATKEVVTHIDRCLSCLACMTTCPSGVHYMHLVDHARNYIEETYRRPLHDRAFRALLANLMPYRSRFRVALALGRLARPFKPILDAIPGLGRLSAMLELVPTRSAVAHAAPLAPEDVAPRRGRVIMQTGCIQPEIRPEINDATRRLVTRLGYEVIEPTAEACCGSLVHHLGRDHEGLAMARHNIDVWSREIDNGGLDAIIITASGCGTTIKDYGFLFRDEPAYAAKAARISALARDITEFLEPLYPVESGVETLTVAYHAACSLQHGQQITERAESAAGASRLQCARDCRGASLLRLRRHLQHSSGADCPPSPRPQDHQHRGREARHHRHRQHRLHDADRRRHSHPDRAHRRAAGLGIWRPEAGGARPRRSGSLTVQARGTSTRIAPGRTVTVAGKRPSISPSTLAMRLPGGAMRNVFASRLSVPSVPRKRPETSAG